MNTSDVLKIVDHTLLTQTATWAEIKEILDDAMKFGTASACIPAAYVKQAAEYVDGKLPICTVIGFPNGYSTTATKVFETKDAIANGAREIDMVINIGFLKDGRYDEVENEIRIELKGTEMGMLIGKRGQTLDSLQYLTSLVANKNKDTYTKIKIDTENYRQRRKETIENLARNVASKVKKTGRPAFLEPMNPYERRIIHAELQADKYVDTHSEGEEPHRKVVITLNREFASELPRRNNYRRRNNNYSRDRKRPYQEKKD